MAKLSEWDFFNRNVQSGLTEGQFLAAQYTLIAAGPPNLAFLGSDDALAPSAEEGDGGGLVFPIGITQRFGMAHTRQHARIWEIGSERSYWISGRTVGQVTLGRIVYHGPNILRALYAYYDNTKSIPNIAVPTLMGESDEIVTANANRNPHEDIRVAPGFRNHFMNLASDLFMQTIGLMIYFKDSNDDSVSAAYLENCVIPTHSVGFDAGGTVIQENVQVQFERMTPIEIDNAIPLIDINSTGKVATAGDGTGVSLVRSTGRNF
jgi:hypothetical protein